MKHLVSIIIPTYNRAHLISDTINSILSQTYIHWECLVIDDSSTDDTETLLNTYIKRDNRFQYYKRPNYLPKGANVCRNIGLEKANGDYIIFFDSDDLMTPNHIELKIKIILDYQCDYVIAKTKFFNYPEGNILLENNYAYESKDISAYNYITQKINWLTLDICIKSKLAKSIVFNEALQSGQEYNYFSNLVLKTSRAVFIEEIVSLRRHHEDSIRGDLRANKLASYQSFYHTYWHTYLDTKNVASKVIRAHLIYKCTMLAYKLPKSYIENTPLLYKAILKELGFKAYYHVPKLYFSVTKPEVA